MNKETVKQIRIIDYLATKGIFPERRQGSAFWYLSPLRQEDTASFKVNLVLNKWYDFGDCNKGDVLDLVMQLEKIANLNDAILWLSENSPHSFSFGGKTLLKETSSESNSLENMQILPLQHVALISLLEKRRIDIVMAKHYCKEVHYDLKGKHYFAIGFSNNSGGYATLNPYFKGCIASNDITSIVSVKNDVALVFEGFMDFLSYLTIKQRVFTANPPQDYHVLNSVHNIEKLLPKLQGYKDIHCFLDNDSSGKKALKRIDEAYGYKVINESKHYSEYKDLNDFLCQKKKTENQKLANKLQNQHRMKR